MARGSLCESQRTQIHPIDRSFKRAFEIEEIEFTFGLGAVLFECASSGDEAERKSFLRQLSSLNNRENTANFEQSDVANTVIEVVTHSVQESRQECGAHPRRIFNDRIGELRLIVLMAGQRWDQLEARVLLNEAEVDCLVEAEGIQRASQGTLLHLAGLILA